MVSSPSFSSEAARGEERSKEPGPATRRPGLDADTGTGLERSPGAVPAYPARLGEGNMQFVDRFLKCSDCNVDFVFTAGEQLFFNDKQFKNDPKRCKLCKAKRRWTGTVFEP